MIETKKTKPHKFQLLDKVRHSNNPNIIYIVETIFADGSYRIIPLNDEIDKAITYATEDCMSLIEGGDDDPTTDTPGV